MDAAIVTIGQEILIGQIVDTNSAWIASELNSVGVDVKKIISIADSIEVIEASVDELINSFGLLLITGGLGPTNDDVTKKALCNTFGSNLVIHGETLGHIEQLFAKRNMPLTELNRQQALVPDNCEPLFNPIGTAPGMWFNRNGKMLISLPGVPFEMKALMELHVLPRLASLSNGQVIIHRTIQTFGLPESFLAERIKEWEDQLPQNISLAYLPAPLSIRLRLSALGKDKQELEHSIENEILKLKSLIPEFVFGFGNDSLSSVVGALLIQTKSTLSVAESCTGGYLAHLVTQTPGSSNYFGGGMVAYANQAKIGMLGVSADILEQFGAVSSEVACQMAAGARKVFGSDFAIATTGIAGPTGATANKPVGLVWIAVATPNQIISQSFIFSGDRERNIVRSSATALNLLRLELLKERIG